MNIREGIHIVYVIEARSIRRGDGLHGEMKKLPDSSWFEASHDAFGFPGENAWQAVGNHGYLSLEKAKEALEWARRKSCFESNDGYGNISCRTVYMFRLRESFLVRKDRVLDL